jgi:hypothetical protein
VYREQHLQRQVDNANDREGTHEVLTIEKLIRRERKRQDRSLIKNPNSKGLTILQIPSTEDPEEWDEISDPPIIEDKLIDRNIDHFSQANGSPVCQAPLVNLFGYGSTTTNMINLIEKGEIPVELRRHPTYVNMLLQRLASGLNLPVIDNNISFDDYFQGFEKWNERTTTSPRVVVISVII